MILDNMRSWQLKPGFWTFGFMNLLGSSGPKVVFRSQTPRVKVGIFRFDNFIGCNLWFWIDWGLVCGKELGFWNCGFVSFSGPSGPAKLKLSPRPKFFSDLMILLELVRSPQKLEVGHLSRILANSVETDFFGENGLVGSGIENELKSSQFQLC